MVKQSLLSMEYAYRMPYLLNQKVCLVFWFVVIKDTNTFFILTVANALCMQKKLAKLVIQQTHSFYFKIIPDQRKNMKFKVIVESFINPDQWPTPEAICFFEKGKKVTVTTLPFPSSY